ncbi:MAG: NAD(P)/FAD-dependent oxidoreductase [Acidobacteriota bacterium]|nr:NAD(P)/FAD-dependent oxidoreductase [Acidobacteriota bacterium]
MPYDAIIIGAGPAGSTAAIRLAQAGHRVLLLEKGRFPREKLCGEFITPECLNVFDRLGVRQRMLEAGARIIRRFNIFSLDGRSLEIPMQWMADGHSHAISLTRAMMDWVLLERARELGVEVREGFHVSPRLTWQGNLTVIEGKADGATIEKYAAPLVIDASGRNGVFSNQVQQQASRLKGSRLFGCKVHLRGVEGLHELGELFFFRDGYGGLTEVEGDRVNLCFLTTEATLLEAKGDRQRLLDLTLRANPAARRRLQHMEVDGEWLGTGPIIYGRRKTIPGVLTIGDAAAFIDPFTGSGMLLAFTSGELAAAVVNESFTMGNPGAYDVETTIKRYNELYRAQFGWRFRICAMLRGLAFKPATRNALMTILSRHQGLMKLAALGTRQRGLKADSI